MLTEIIVNQQRMLSVVAEMLAEGDATVRRDKLQRRRFRGGRGNHGGVFHRAVFVQRLDQLGNSRTLLTNRDIDTLNALAFLIDDGVDRDCGLAGLAIADDQLTLSAANLKHQIDRLDAGLQRFLNRLALHDAGSLDFDAPGLEGFDRTLAIDRLTERVNDEAEHRIADRNLRDFAGALYLVALADRFGIAEQHGADVVFFEVEHHPHDGVGKFEQLARRRILQAVDARDAVT